MVAAITLPSLTGNINERTWNTQRKALYARMSQAISLMPALNGYGTLKEASSEGASDAEDNATETFITAGLSKVLKINNICDNEHLADCGVVTSYTDMTGSSVNAPTTLYELNSWFNYVQYSGSSYSTINTKAAAFETQNGESIVAYYNQTCRTEYINQESVTDYGSAFGFPEATMCLNLVYDLNGKKGPNTVGKDIGIITVFNATDSIVVAPVPASARNAGNGTKYEWIEAVKLCKTEDSESRLPNIDELSSMIINKDIIGLSAAESLWSGTSGTSERAWEMSPNVGARFLGSKDFTYYVRCVKR